MFVKENPDRKKKKKDEKDKEYKYIKCYKIEVKKITMYKKMLQN